MRSLDRQTHRGLWAAIPTPWNEQGSLDTAALQQNCQRLAAAGVDGIYTTDSDGEFYAVENDEFRKLSIAFGEALRGLKVDAAMGVSWVNTSGTIERIRAACDAGIANVHVAFPCFMPLATPDVFRFFADLARAVPEARWIHYAHPACGPILTGIDYALLASEFPEQLIGTKLGTSSITELTEIMVSSPQLSHFVVDTTFVVGMGLGARGCCSYWINTLPKWQRAWMDDCLAGRWEAAIARHKRLIEWELRYVAPLRAAGHRHGIISKARAALTGFLDDSGITRAPYYPVDLKMREHLHDQFRSFWADEIIQEHF